MNSIWKDLLFLHGHLVRKEDLPWRTDTQARPLQGKLVAPEASRAMLTSCAATWPRLIGPH